MAKERLHKLLARAGVASRRKAEQIILDGRVKLNGRTVTELGVCAEQGVDRVEVDGKIIKVEAPHFYCFHKPKNVISTMDDPAGRPCLNDYAKELPVRVFPVGRLDFDVSGLVLLTNDGAFAEQLLHPRFAVERVYWAEIRDQLNAKTVRLLERGVTLEDGPARVLRLREVSASGEIERFFGRLDRQMSVAEIVVAEGRNHFIKRLMEAVGHPVEKLCRIAFGPFHLEKLHPGQIKEVSPYK